MTKGYILSAAAIIFQNTKLVAGPEHSGPVTSAVSNGNKSKQPLSQTTQVIEKIINSATHYTNKQKNKSRVRNLEFGNASKSSTTLGKEPQMAFHLLPVVNLTVTSTDVW